ncbi:MAG: ester cyclase [Propionibacteriaceae bacterium]|nr:ester cyclase [Propionibacteriaceae bacterium]
MINAAFPACQRVLEAINSGDLTCIPECVTDDFVDHGAPFPIPPGPEGYAQILGFVTSVLKVHYEPEEVIQTPDRIIMRATASGVGSAAFHGPGAEGKPFAMTTIHIYRTEGDKLAEHWGIRDEMGAALQMGLIPSPPEPPR